MLPIGFLDLVPTVLIVGGVIMIGWSGHRRTRMARIVFACLISLAGLALGCVRVHGRLAYRSVFRHVDDVLRTFESGGMPVVTEGLGSGPNVQELQKLRGVQFAEVAEIKLMEYGYGIYDLRVLLEDGSVWKCSIVRNQNPSGRTLSLLELRKEKEMGKN
ncbi:MAG: hypothetical protein GY851_23640 [bacterium]|nr:hypothetical protein [bacterium]